jgi:hypothetical protein
VDAAATDGDAADVVVRVAVAAAAGLADAAVLAVAAGLVATPVVTVGTLAVVPAAGAVDAAELAAGAVLRADAAVAGGTLVAVELPPHAARSAAPPDKAPSVSRKVRRFIVRGLAA